MKKTLVALMLACTLLLGCFTAAQAMPSDHDISYYYVSTSNHGSLNMRDSESADAKVIVQIPYATKLEVYDYAPGAKWALCVYGQYEGYVMTRYLSDRKPAGSPAATTTTTTTVGSESAEYKRMEPSCYYAVVHPATPTGYVHMRWAPSKKEPVMRDYYDGKVLKVMYQDATWCQVYDEETGICGYMMRSFLTYAGAAEATTYTVGTIAQ